MEILKSIGIIVLIIPIYIIAFGMLALILWGISALIAEPLVRNRDKNLKVENVIIGFVISIIYTVISMGIGMYQYLEQDGVSKWFIIATGVLFVLSTFLKNIVLKKFDTYKEEIITTTNGIVISIMIQISIPMVLSLVEILKSNATTMNSFIEFLKFMGCFIIICIGYISNYNEVTNFDPKTKM